MQKSQKMVTFRTEDLFFLFLYLVFTIIWEQKSAPHFVKTFFSETAPRAKPLSEVVSNEVVLLK